MAAGKSALEYLIDEEPRAGAAGAERKSIAQVVEHELFVGAIGDVTCVSALPLLRELSVLDQPDGETERIVDGRELLGVAACEIVVNRDDMNGAAHQRGGDRRQQRRQGLAFAGFHFGEGAAHHGGAAEQLNGEQAHPDVTTRRLARKRKREPPSRASGGSPTPIVHAAHPQAHANAGPAGLRAGVPDPRPAAQSA